MNKPTLLTVLSGALFGVAASAKASMSITPDGIHKAASAVKQLSHLAQNMSGEQLPLQFAAVPEPSTWVLIAVGIPVLLFVAYRRRKKAA